MVHHREKERLRSKKYREEKREADPTWNVKEAKRKSASRSKESESERSARLQQMRGYARERRFYLCPTYMGRRVASTRGVLKGIKTVSQLTGNSGLRTELLLKALKHTEKFKPPYTMEELDRKLKREITSSLDAQKKYIDTPNHPNLLREVRCYAKDWFERGLKDTRFPLTSNSNKSRSRQQDFSTLDEVVRVLHPQVSDWLKHEYALATNTRYWQLLVARE